MKPKVELVGKVVQQPLPERGDLWHYNRRLGCVVEVVEVMEGLVYFHFLTNPGGRSVGHHRAGKEALRSFRGQARGYTYLRPVKEKDYD